MLRRTLAVICLTVQPWAKSTLLTQQQATGAILHVPIHHHAVTACQHQAVEPRSGWD